MFSLKNRITKGRYDSHLQVSERLLYKRREGLVFGGGGMRKSNGREDKQQ